MQGSWYKYFLFSLRYYYRSKDFFLFFFKLILILKLISIFLDIYFGFFPNIFKDTIYWFYLLKFYNYIFFNYLYWLNSFWILILFIFLFFWFFFRVGFLDNVEILKRRKLKEQELKNKEKENDSMNYVINIKKKNDLIKRKVKNLEKFINKNL